MCSNFGQRLQIAMQLQRSDSTELPPYLFSIGVIDVKEARSAFNFCMMSAAYLSTCLYFHSVIKS